MLWIVWSRWSIEYVSGNFKLRFEQSYAIESADRFEFKHLNVIYINITWKSHMYTWAVIDVSNVRLLVDYAAQH